MFQGVLRWFKGLFAFEGELESPPEQEYYFLFSPARTEHPLLWRWLCRSGFGHVQALFQLGNMVQGLDWRAICLTPYGFYHPCGSDRVLPVELVAVDCALKGMTVVSIRYKRPNKWVMLSPCNIPSTCVTLCKHLLGVSIPVWTPGGFYRWLLLNGGQALTVSEQDAILRRYLGVDYATVAEDKSVFAWIR